MQSHIPINDTWETENKLLFFIPSWYILIVSDIGLVDKPSFSNFHWKETKDVLSTDTFPSTPPCLPSGFSYTLLLPPFGAQIPLLPAAEWSCCWRPAFTLSSLSAEETLLTISHTHIKARTQGLLNTRIQIGILGPCPKKDFHAAMELGGPFNP